MTPEQVISFWFGPLEQGLCHPDRRRALFKADAAFDAEIRAGFGTWVERALAGDLGNWGEEAPGRLALVLLLDQFPRNLFRGKPRAFAGDESALAHARAAVAAGQDRVLPPEPRAFLYLPFEHAEDLAAQDEGLALMTALADEQAPDSAAASVVTAYLGHFHEHRRLVAEFGRFPHRNAILGRADTDAEKIHMAQDGRAFGQR